MNFNNSEAASQELIFEHYKKWVYSLSFLYPQLKKALYFLYFQINLDAVSQNNQLFECQTFDYKDFPHKDFVSQSGDTALDPVLSKLSQQQWVFRLVFLLKKNCRLSLLKKLVQELTQEKMQKKKTLFVRIIVSRALSYGEIERIGEKIAEEKNCIIQIHSVRVRKQLTGGIIVDFSDQTQWDASKNRKFQFLYQLMVRRALGYYCNENK
jgi:F0F1-type ATP synthase delta subunit